MYTLELYVVQQKMLSGCNEVGLMGGTAVIVNDLDPCNASLSSSPSPPPPSQVALFSTCMGGLMFFYETDPTSVPSFLRNILSRILALSALPSPESILPLSTSHPSNLHQLQSGKDEGVRRRVAGRRGKGGEGDEAVDNTEVTVMRLEENAFQGL